MTRQTSSSSRLLIASLFLLSVVVNSSLQLRSARILQAHGHDEKHVDADDHNHALELHACEGTELELTGDATLEAVNVDNVKSFLVTNEELTTCEEIEALKCKAGASFCKTWSAGPANSAAQHVELVYNQFRDGKAHFYAMAEDKKYVMSANVKVHPHGAQNTNAHHEHHHGAHKEEHVHDDSHYHALELHECTGTSLELPAGGDALLDVASVNNAKRYLVTEIELETCEDIKHFQCKSGSQFCHIWDAKADEMVVLNHTLFKNNEAFLYVEPINEAQAVGINVKIVPAVTDKDGNVHAANDLHPHEHNSGKSNGSHTEHHMEVDGHTHSVQLHACTGTTLELAGDATISAHNVFNGKRWMVTNIEMQSCEQIEAFACQTEATFCHIWNAKEEKTVALKYNLFTGHEAFFYAEPEDHNQEVSLNIKLIPEGPQSHEPHPHGAYGENRMSVDSHMHSLELHECSGTTFELKGDTVMEAENVSNAKFFMVTDVELETCEEILAWKCPVGANLCHIWPAEYPEDVLMHTSDFPNGEAFFYVQPINNKDAISVNVKLETLAEHDPHHGTLINMGDFHINHSLEHVVIYGAIVTLVILLITSYCYRRYMYRYKQAPFNAPFWCPSFLFPQYDSETHENFISHQTKKQESQELNAGIIRQVDV